MGKKIVVGWWAENFCESAKILKKNRAQPKLVHKSPEKADPMSGYSSLRTVKRRQKGQSRFSLNHFLKKVQPGFQGILP